MFKYEFVEVPIKGGLRAGRTELLKNARKSLQKKLKKVMNWYK